MRRVIWTDEAVANLENIAAYISDFSPLAAQRFALRLQTTANSLADNPDRGRLMHGGRRELTVIRPYLIRYRVYEDVVVILGIRHGARRPD